MTRTHSWPEGHWKWPIAVSHKHGVRQGDLCFVGGQVDLDPSGTVLHAGDLAAQAPVTIGALGRVLEDLGSGLSDLVKLVVYHVDDGALDEGPLLALLAEVLPGERPAICTVPVPYLAYPGMLIEIEGVAAIGPKTRVGGGLFPAGVRCGELIWTSAVTGGAKGDIVHQSEEVMERLRAILGELGADFADVVKFNIFYVGAGTFEDWEVAARGPRRLLRRAGPRRDGHPPPPPPGPREPDQDGRVGHARRRRRPDRPHLLLARGPLGLADPPAVQARQPRWRDVLRRRPGVADAAGAADRLRRPDGETHTAMQNIAKVLDGLGVSMDDVVKVTTFYEGDGSGDDLHANLSIRSSYFTEPGPATTGISLPALAYDGMVIEIEVIGMVRER